MCRTLLLLSVAVAVTFVVLAQETNDTATTTNNASTTDNTTMASNLTLDGVEFSKLTKLLGFAGLTNLLQRTEPFTLFAPNDAAFDVTAAELRGSNVIGNDSYDIVVDALKSVSSNEGEDVARSVLNYHMVVDGKFTIEQLNEQRNFLTAQGRYLGVAGSRVIDASFTSTNPEIGAVVSESETGVIYRIGSVLFPFAVLRTGTNNAAGGGSGGGGATSTTNTSANDGASGTAGDGTATGTATGGETGEESPRGGSVCFPAGAVVKKADGTVISMEDIRAGDLVQVDQHGTTSAVIAFTHRILDGYYRFIRLEADGVVLELSGAHYVYANEKVVRADSVLVGDILTKMDGGRERVKKVSAVMRRGLVAPHTHHGNIIVNGVVCSTYTALLPHNVAHSVLVAVRGLSRLGFKEPLGTLFYDGWRSVRGSAWHVDFRSIASFLSVFRHGTCSR